MNILGHIRSLLSRRASVEPRETESLAQRALRQIDEGNVIEDQGDLDGAMRRYEAALSLVPTLGRGHLNRGNVLLARRDFGGALKAYETALRHQPEFPSAHFNIGNALRSCNRLDEALCAYDRAIEQKQEFVDAHVARAAILDDLGRFDEAVAGYRQALALAPNYAEVHSNLARVLRSQGRFGEALVSYRRALQLKPDYADGHCGIGGLLKDIGQIDAAIASYQHALQIRPDDADALSGLLFVQNYRADQPEVMLFEAAKKYGGIVRSLARPYVDWNNNPDPERILRVGFVSGDLRVHPVGFFLESTLAALAARAPKQIAMYAYSAHNVDDFLTRRIQAYCDAWRVVVGMPDEVLAQLVRDDGIDILVDLSGHTGYNRLSMFAWKPAPVQVTWLGYFATTGVAAIDYLLADSWSLPESEAGNFVEEIWRLPETRLCFTPPDDDVAVAELPALRNGYLTFGCFNHLAKMTDEVVALWARAMRAVPGSRLLLKSPPLVEDSVQATIRQRFGSHDIGPERLLFEGLSSRKAYLEAYGRIDISLDPFPYPGGATSAESLWMGVPVLTMMGKRFLSRQGSGIVMSLGLSDWVARDRDDYLRIAIEKSGNLDALASLRGRLRSEAVASPFFDAVRFSSHLNDALRGMWVRWCRRAG